MRKKLKFIMRYIPSEYYDKKDKAFFFLKVNNGKKAEVRLDKVGNKTDMTYNELMNKIREQVEGEVGE